MSSGGRVVVVGGGIVGASAALRLAEGGADVVLVDDAREGRATYAGAGIVAAPRGDPGEPSFELRLRAVAAYPELAARIGARLDIVGELFVAPPGRLLDDAEVAFARAGPVLRLGPEQARAAFPYLAPELAALHIATTARVQGEDIREHLTAAARAAGAVLMRGFAELVRGAGGVEAVVVAGRRIRTDTVVVAAGTWSSQFVSRAGVTLAVIPHRGQIAHLTVREDTTELPVVQPLDADHYLVAFPDRRIVAGATREANSGFDLSLTAGGVAQVLADALRIAPGLGGATLRELRVGLRPATPDGDPILGAVPGCRGLWAATGLGRQGLTIGPFCGRLVADAVLGRPLEVDLRPFAPDRFG